MTPTLDATSPSDTGMIDLPGMLPPGVAPTPGGFQGRTAVFGGGPGPAGGGSSDQDNIEVPTSQVPLPSLGRIYPQTSPLHGQDSVLIKSMTTREEDLLMSTPLIQKGTVINELVRSCLLVRGCKVEELLSGDRNALMVAIRISGYGPDYVCPMKCPKCEYLAEHYTINLEDLQIRFLELEPSVSGQNRFSFTLPMSKRVVEFKFLTVEDEEDILRDLEARKKRGLQNQQAVTTRLLKSLVSVNGNEDRKFVTKFASNMAARDSLALRTWVDQHEPTVEMKTRFTCESCDHGQEVAVPFGVGFFWPGISGESGSRGQQDNDDALDIDNL